MSIFNIMKNRIIGCLFIMAFALLICIGCGKNDDGNGVEYDIYYLSANEYSIVSNAASFAQTEAGELVSAFIEEMKTTSDMSKYHPVLDETVGFSGYSISDNQVIVDFNSNILSIDNTKRILIRAALTRTLTQIKDISVVSCTVEGQPMTDSSGAVVGQMTADMFVDNGGAQINSDEKTKLTLYFASEDGTKLVPVSRNITYSSNIALDKLAIEQLILGPVENEQGYAVISPNTSIISITSQDGTCYVNLDNAFLLPPGNISNDVAIYSIVDTLIELGNINKVQIMVNGESAITYREKVDLSAPFSRNLDIIE